MKYKKRYSDVFGGYARNVWTIHEDGSVTRNNIVTRMTKTGEEEIVFEFDSNGKIINKEVCNA